MTVMADLEREVKEAKEALEQAVAELESFADLKGRLEGTDRKLTETAELLDGLSNSLAGCQESLSAASRSLSQAVRIFSETDFGEIRGEIQAIGEQVKAVGARLGDDLREGLGQATDKITVNTNDAISGSARQQNRLLYAILALAAATLLVSLSGFFGV